MTEPYSVPSSGRMRRLPLSYPITDDLFPSFSLCKVAVGCSSSYLVGFLLIHPCI